MVLVTCFDGGMVAVARMFVLLRFVFPALGAEQGGGGVQRRDQGLVEG